MKSGAAMHTETIDRPCMLKVQSFGFLARDTPSGLKVSIEIHHGFGA